MEISKEIYDWLLSYQIVSLSEIVDDSQEDKLVLDNLSTQQLESGVRIAKLIKALYLRNVTPLLEKGRQVSQTADNYATHGNCLRQT